MKFSKVVKQVIKLGEAFQEYVENELPRRYPNYPLVDESEDLEVSAPERRLMAYLSKLPMADIYQLALLMYLGRGDFEATHLRERFREVKVRFPKPQWAVWQMAGKASLGEYLEEGAARLEKQGVALDDLPVQVSAAADRRRAS